MFIERDISRYRNTSGVTGVYLHRLSDIFRSAGTKEGLTALIHTFPTAGGQKIFLDNINICDKIHQKIEN